MIAHIPNLEKRLAAFDIAPKFFNEFRALVEGGARPSKELRTRLKHVANYKAALDSILAELSQPVIAQHFPPQTDHFESLEIV